MNVLRSVLCCLFYRCEEKNSRYVTTYCKELFYLLDFYLDYLLLIVPTNFTSSDTLSALLHK